MRRLYEVVIEVDAEGRAPLRYSRAAVYAVAFGSSPSEAVRLVRNDLENSGYVMLGSPPRIRELSLDAWSEYVETQWAGLRAQLPTQGQLSHQMDREFVLQVSLYPHE